MAADWRPTETVRLIVPAAAGGTTDVMGRLLAAHLQTAWGQSAIVENRSGAGGTIGTSEVVRSKGDGHTILVGNPGPNAIAYSDLQEPDLQGRAVAAGLQHDPDPEHRLGASSTGIKSIPELIAYLKANPDKLTYGSSGVGQSPHLTGAWFLQLTGTEDDACAVPRRRPGAAGGAWRRHPDPVRQPLSVAAAGAWTASSTGSAVTTPERSAGGARTSDHARERRRSWQNSTSPSWFGVFLPKTRAGGCRRCRSTSEMKAMLERDDIKKNIAAMGARADYGTPQQFSDFVDAGDQEVREPSSRRKACRWR